MVVRNSTARTATHRNDWFLALVRRECDDWIAHHANDDSLPKQHQDEVRQVLDILKANDSWWKERCAAQYLGLAGEDERRLGAILGDRSHGGRIAKMLGDDGIARRIADLLVADDGSSSELNDRRLFLLRLVDAWQRSEVMEALSHEDAWRVFLGRLGWGKAQAIIGDDSARRRIAVALKPARNHNDPPSIDDPALLGDVIRSVFLKADVERSLRQEISSVIFACVKAVLAKATDHQAQHANRLKRARELALTLNAEDPGDSELLGVLSERIARWEHEQSAADPLTMLIDEFLAVRAQGSFAGPVRIDGLRGLVSREIDKRFAHALAELGFAVDAGSGMDHVVSLVGSATNTMGQRFYLDLRNLRWAGHGKEGYGIVRLVSHIRDCNITEALKWCDDRFGSVLLPPEMIKEIVEVLGVADGKSVSRRRRKG